MSKRGHDSIQLDDDRPWKRARLHSLDRLSSLSDELILRTLSYLPVSTLALCQRLSPRFYTLAGDSQLWKSAYYTRFVRPRASRIPGLKDRGITSSSLTYSSKISNWLEDGRLVERGQETNWKRQYKLRHNWSQGACDMSEIQVLDSPPSLPLLVRLRDGIIVTADGTAGLRAWTMEENKPPIASQDLPRRACGSDNSHSDSPTSLSLDIYDSAAMTLTIAVGFASGRFSIHVLDVRERRFLHQYSHAASSNGTVSAIALASPYILTMTEAQLLSIYAFDIRPAGQVLGDTLKSPELLSSLASHSVWPPISLSVRVSSTHITASIAYAMPTYLSGWHVSLQELRLASDGKIITSRYASTIDHGFIPLTPKLSDSSSPHQVVDSSPSKPPSTAIAPSSTKPTSLSYTHPYLLTAHPDNTLTLFLVTSDANLLSINGGVKLWGHTSSVSGAYIGDRGKAVSVSSYGDEIRVWELEGGPSSSMSRRCFTTGGEVGVQVRPGRLKSSSCGSNRDLRSMVGSTIGELDEAKGWVGFDEEKLVVHREKGHGVQCLVIYDFA